MAGRDVRSEILGAALATLSAGETLTYEGLAARAGVSRQTLYRYFPTRAELLIATVEHAREAAGADAAGDDIYAAPTAVDALRALVAFHVAFVPRLLPAYLAVERERSTDPEVDAAFRARTRGRRQLARLVGARLAGEGALAEPWSAETAADVIHALTSGACTAQFLRDAGWSVGELSDRLLQLLERTLLTPIPKGDPT